MVEQKYIYIFFFFSLVSLLLFSSQVFQQASKTDETRRLLCSLLREVGYFFRKRRCNCDVLIMS